MRALGVLLILVVAACGRVPAATSPRAALTPSAAASSSLPLPTASSVAGSPSPAVSPLPSPSPPTQPSLSGLNLACRLPLTTNTSTGQELAGFVDFPGRTFTVDASAPATTTYYDAVFSKWLPSSTDGNLVSADGSQYLGVISAPDADTWHLVNLKSGQDQVIYKSAGVPTRLVPIALTPDGIYVSSVQGGGESYPQGLWLMNPTTRQLRLITNAIYWPVVGNGEAWGVYTSTADPNPFGPGIGFTADAVRRFVAANQSLSTVLYRPGTLIHLVGVDHSNDLFIDVSYPDPAIPSTEGVDEMWLLAPNGNQRRLLAFNYSTAASGARLATPTPSAGQLTSMPYDVGAVDEHGVWFAAFDSTGQETELSLYANGSMRVVAILNGEFQIAGDCV